MVEHPRLLEQGLGDPQRAMGVAGEQHPLGQLSGRPEVDRLGPGTRHGRDDMGDCPAMAEGRGKPQNVSEAVREAVQRTVQTTVGSAQLTRGRAQEAVDEIVRGAEARAGAVRERVRSAEAGAGAVRDRVREVLGEHRPATAEDVREVGRQLGEVGRRLERIERRLQGVEAEAREAARAAAGDRPGGASAGGRRAPRAASPRQP
jgi:hypothetical protein